MQNKLAIKVAIIAVLSAALLIPLSMIQGVISARQQRQDEVKASIAQASAGEQKLTGPLVAMFYKERVERSIRDANGRETVSVSIADNHVVLPPRQLGIKGRTEVETLYRGLYPARLFHATLQLSGNATIPARLGLDADRHIFGARAFLILGVTDLRGVDNEPALEIGGVKRRFAAGTQGVLKGQGLHADLGDVDLARETGFEFSLPLQLTGTERLAIAPAGDVTTLSLASNWPHPSFQGSFLPRTRSVSADGFEAEWRTSQLARSFTSLLESDGAAGSGAAMEVRFVEPVNVYLQSERAVKYGLLFVVVTFAAFFLCEILRSLAIHPMQYLLVGLALAVFFLLLIALSEHLSFALSYLISSVACTGLITAYLAGVLDTRLGGAAFGTGLAALYGVLYVVLMSEDSALVMGAVLIFLVLGAVMLGTRRLDWYRLAESHPALKAQPAAPAPEA